MSKDGKGKQMELMEWSDSDFDSEARDDSDIDLFVVDALDVTLKSDMASMEHPFYTPSKKPSTEPKTYSNGNATIEFRPSSKGFPTIYDKDIVIYGISYAMREYQKRLDRAKERYGQEYDADKVQVPEAVSFEVLDFFAFANRSDGGTSYSNLVHSIDRLHGSTFKSNVEIGGVVTTEWRRLVGDVRLRTIESKRRNRLTGEMEVVSIPREITIELGPTIAGTLRAKSVLSLHRDYFKLHPTERRLYEIGRKHLGQQKDWKIRLSSLQRKIGSLSSSKEFKRTITRIIEDNKIPDFTVEWTEVTYRKRRKTTKELMCLFKPKDHYKQAYEKKVEKGTELPPLTPETIEKAKNVLPDGSDVYEHESIWREYWRQNGRKKIDNLEAAFLGFCKKANTE